MILWDSRRVWIPWAPSFVQLLLPSKNIKTCPADRKVTGENEGNLKVFTACTSSKAFPTCSPVFHKVILQLLTVCNWDFAMTMRHFPVRSAMRSIWSMLANSPPRRRLFRTKPRWSSAVEGPREPPSHTNWRRGGLGRILFSSNR